MLLGAEFNPAACCCDFSKLVKAVSVNTKSLLSGLYLTGLLNTITHCFKLKTLGPSTRQDQFLYSLRRLFHRSCFDSTLALPKIIKPYFALVRATLSLLGSLRKPIPLASLLLTHDRRMKSFSRPQKLSTEATSISLYRDASSWPDLYIQLIM